LKSTFLTWLIKTADAHQAAFMKMFYEKITADSVAKDVNFLRNTFYPLVSKTEAEGGYDGGYVPHKYT